MLPPIWFIYWSFAQFFVICDICQRVTSHYEIDIYTDWEWYKFPENIRRALPIAIIGNQMPIEVKGLGNIECTRDTFKKMILQL